MCVCKYDISNICMCVSIYKYVCVVKPETIKYKWTTIKHESNIYKSKGQYILLHILHLVLHKKKSKKSDKLFQLIRTHTVAGELDASNLNKRI